MAAGLGGGGAGRSVFMWPWYNQGPPSEHPQAPKEAERVISPYFSFSRHKLLSCLRGS